MEFKFLTCCPGGGGGGGQCPKENCLFKGCLSSVCAMWLNVTGCAASSQGLCGVLGTSLRENGEVVDARLNQSILWAGDSGN